MTTARNTCRIPILLFGCALSAAYPSATAWSASSQRFDGIWNVAITCAKASDGALPYSWSFSATVKAGRMLGYYKQPGTVPSGTLSGQIDSSGNALLLMRGLTGKTPYTIGRENPGSPFSYTVTAHFDSDRGTGKRNETRECALNFIRQ